MSLLGENFSRALFVMVMAVSVERARHAMELGCLLTVDSDAHKVSEFGFLEWGISQARRAWLEPQNVLNTRSRKELLDWLRAR